MSYILFVFHDTHGTRYSYPWLKKDYISISLYLRKSSSGLFLFLQPSIPFGDACHTPTPHPKKIILTMAGIHYHSSIPQNVVPHFAWIIFITLLLPSVSRAADGIHKREEDYPARTITMAVVIPSCVVIAILILWGLIRHQQKLEKRDGSDQGEAGGDQGGQRVRYHG